MSSPNTFRQLFRQSRLCDIFADGTPISIHDPSLAWLGLPPPEFLEYARGRENFHGDRLGKDDRNFVRDCNFLQAQVHRVWLTASTAAAMLTADSVVLDLGAFPFTIELVLREYFGLKCPIHGTVNQPLSPEMLRDLDRCQIEVVGCNLDPLVKCDPAASLLLDELPLPDMSVDFILFSHVIEHLYHPLTILQEAARVLKPGGSILVSTDNAFLLPGMMHILDNDGFVHEPVSGTAAMVFHSWRGHVRYFTATDLQTMLTAVGLRPTRTEFNEILYNSLLEGFFYSPMRDFPRWQADLLTALPYLRNDVVVVAQKTPQAPNS